MTNLQAKIDNHQAAIDSLRKQQAEENAVGKCYRNEAGNCYYLTLPEDRYLAVHMDVAGNISIHGLTDHSFRGVPEITFPEFMAAYKKRMSEIHMAATGEELFGADEKVAKVIQTVVQVYDKKFGDDRVCQCGHTYIRHFDWGDEYRLGCKYCDCQKFVERTAVAALIRSERAKAYADGRRAGLKNAEEIASYQLLESRNQDEHAAIAEVMNKIREAGKK